MQVSGTRVTRHCDQASRVAKAMLKQFSRGRSILSFIFLQGVKKKKNKKRIRENYTNYPIKRNHSCIKLFRWGGGEKDLTECLSPCLKCNTVLSKPGGQRNILQVSLCSIWKQEPLWDMIHFQSCSSQTQGLWWKLHISTSNLGSFVKFTWSISCLASQISEHLYFWV